MVGRIVLWSEPALGSSGSTGSMTRAVKAWINALKTTRAGSSAKTLPAADPP
jgi:hypothetical protein